MYIRRLPTAVQAIDIPYFLEYKPCLECRPGVWRNCTNRGLGLLFEEIR